jgi:hypothetical protein
VEFVIFDSDFNYIKAMTEEKQTIQIRCKNNKKTQNVAIGSSLSEVFRQFNLKMDYGPISAKVNNKVEAFITQYNEGGEFTYAFGKPSQGSFLSFSGRENKLTLEDCKERVSSIINKRIEAFSI